jgi:hypothetical protein
MKITIVISSERSESRKQEHLLKPNKIKVY